MRWRFDRLTDADYKLKFVVRTGRENNSSRLFTLVLLHFKEIKYIHARKLIKNNNKQLYIKGTTVHR